MIQSEPVRQELRATLRLAAPVVLVQLGSMLMGVVDTLMVGHLSAEALASAALAHIIVITVLMFGVGILQALDPLISQAFGAGDAGGVADHLQRGLVMAAALSLPISLLMLDTRGALALVGQQPEVIDGAAGYIRAVAWGNLPFFLFTVVRLTLQAQSIVRPAAMAMVVGNVVNVIVNYSLIFGKFGMPALGVVGSAYSTALSRWCMCLYLVFAARGALAPYWRGFTGAAASLRHYARLVRLGLPIGLHNSLELCLFLTVALLIGRMGVAQLGGHQIALNLASLSFMVPMGIAGAASTRVGNAIGRGDMPGARRAAAVCLCLGAGVMVLFGILFASAPRFLASLYTTDAAVLAVAVALLPIAAAFQIFDGVQVVSAGVLRGSADTTYPAALALFGFWALGLPGGWYMASSLGLGPRGLWWGLTLGLAAVSTLFVLRIVSRFRSQISREMG
jgi:MATE family multidrug resistance protein